MILFSVFFLQLLFTEETFYVATNGTNSESCGSQTYPCATINQVILNYPGTSCMVSVESGAYATNAIVLQRAAYVVIEGTGNTTVTATWSGNFVTNTGTSGIEFNDMALIISGGGSTFTTLNASSSVGFYNITLTFFGYSGDFVNVNGGVLVVSNVTLSNAAFDSYFIAGISEGYDSNITITGSHFVNITISEIGAFLVLNAYGSTSILVNSTSFDDIIVGYVFIGFWAMDFNQNVSITNSVFNNTNTYLPCVYVENGYDLVFFVQNTTWNNATADFVAGSALEVLGPDNGSSPIVTLEGVKVTNCPNGPPILIAYSSLVLSDSSFSGNHGKVASDLCLTVDASSQFGCNITNSFSSSNLPKAVVTNTSTSELEDISYLLPDAANP